MLETFERIIDRVLTPVPAHLLIVSGMLLLGLTVITPAWMESRELGWQVALMKVQAQRLDEQEKSYRQFNDALANDDPVLLERLAYYHLHLKPAGSATLTASLPAGNAPETPGVAMRRAKAAFARIPTVEELLHRPIPQAGVNTPAYQPIRTRLVSLTTGPMRVGVIAAGLLCLLAGMTSPLVVTDEEEKDQLPMTLPIEEPTPRETTALPPPLGGRLGGGPIDQEHTKSPPPGLPPRGGGREEESHLAAVRRHIHEVGSLLRFRLGRWGA